MKIFAEYSGKKLNNQEERQYYLNQISISHAEEKDIEDLAMFDFRLDDKTFEHQVAKFKKEILPENDTDTHLLLIARFDESIVGYGRCKHFKPPENAPVDCAPEGWYLLGVVTEPQFRRKGVGLKLTYSRLEWISRKNKEAYYFANALNVASIDLHDKLNFKEVTRDFVFPDIQFRGGKGILFKVDLTDESWKNSFFNYSSWKL
jgi:ribosomal protein S18 acetylase RimI-like enzyme